MLGLGVGINTSVAASGEFSLADISGLVSWYKFNTLHTLSSGALASWGDSSGNGNTLTNIGATNKRPTVEASGRVDWGDVPNSFMEGSSFVAASQPDNMKREGELMDALRN